MYEPETGHAGELYDARARSGATVSRIGERRRVAGRDRRHLRRRRARRAAPAPLRPVGNGGVDVQVHLVTPHSFNDAQEIADKFKQGVPVILNLQTTDAELAKRLIDFASGLTYALDGGMQKIADKTFLLTPAQRRGLGRGAGPPRREGLLQPELGGVVPAASAYASADEGRLRRSGKHGRGDGARLGRAARAAPRRCSFCDLDRERAEALADEVGGETRDGLAELGADVRPGRPGREAGGARRRSPASSTAAPALLSVLAATPLARLAEAFPGRAG